MAGYIKTLISPLTLSLHVIGTEYDESSFNRNEKILQNCNEIMQAAQLYSLS